MLQANSLIMYNRMIRTTASITIFLEVAVVANLSHEGCMNNADGESHLEARKKLYAKFSIPRAGVGISQ